jgi:hypothetical protein
MREHLKAFIRENFKWDGTWYPKEDAAATVQPELNREFHVALDEVAKEHNASLE